MALRANLQVYILTQSRFCLDYVATATSGCNLFILGMDTRFHLLNLSADCLMDGLPVVSDGE